MGVLGSYFFVPESLINLAKKINHQKEYKKSVIMVLSLQMESFKSIASVH